MPVEDNDLPHLEPVDRTPVEGIPGATKGSSRDSGTYEAEEFEEDEVIVRLCGRRVSDGRCAIFRTAEGTGWSTG